MLDSMNSPGSTCAVNIQAQFPSIDCSIGHYRLERRIGIPDVDLFVSHLPLALGLGVPSPARALGSKRVREYNLYLLDLHTGWAHVTPNEIRMRLFHDEA